MAIVPRDHWRTGAGAGVEDQDDASVGPPHPAPRVQSITRWSLATVPFQTVKTKRRVTTLILCLHRIRAVGTPITGAFEFFEKALIPYIVGFCPIQLTKVTKLAVKRVSPLLNWLAIEHGCGQLRYSE